jgi:prepilin-type processing-associated H-X9-DG protein
MGFAGEHDGRFQLSATEGTGDLGVTRVDPARQTYAYDDLGEILAWPVALAQASGVEYATNWDWGVRANTYSDALDKRDKISTDFELVVCPADQAQFSTPFYPTGTEALKGSGDPQDPVVPSGGTRYWGYLSYGVNEDIVGTEARTHSGQPLPACWKDGVRGEEPSQPQWDRAGKRLRGVMDRVFSPGTCLLIVDAGPNSQDEAVAGEFEVHDEQGWGYANLITSAQAIGPFLPQSVYRWFQRIPTKRHPGGAINATFADFHAATLKVTAWRNHPTLGERVPAQYSELVRVSPYHPPRTYP